MIRLILIVLVLTILIYILIRIFPKFKYFFLKFIKSLFILILLKNLFRKIF